jgi:hypothetical protein
MTENIQSDELEDFLRQCERNLKRSLEVYKPVLDDAPWRSFNSTADYRKWCHENLPEYLGYGEPNDLQLQVLNET